MCVCLLLRVNVHEKLPAAFLHLKHTKTITTITKTAANTARTAATIIIMNGLSVNDGDDDIDGGSVVLSSGLSESDEASIAG